jgi:hypothetical protein
VSQAGKWVSSFLMVALNDSAIAFTTDPAHRAWLDIVIA